MKTIKSILLPVTFVVLVGSAKAQFLEFTRIDTGAIYESVGTFVNSSNSLFDFDNDGDFDPITSHMNAVGIYKKPNKLYRNERNGFYIQKQYVNDPASNFTVNNHSPIGDLDNDGDIDIVAQKHGTTNLGIYFNDGYGNFSLDTIMYRSTSVPSFVYSLYPLIIDFNGDGYLDILSFDKSIVANYNNGNGKFIIQDTIGVFNQNISNDWLHSMAIGDVDNDGDMDIYCGLSIGIQKNVLLINKGDFFEQVDENHSVLCDSAPTTSVNWVDFDNDGDMDLFTTNESPGTETGVLPALFENKGNLEFEKHNIIDKKYRGSFTISDYWGDLDNDGDQDLFISLEDGPYPFSGPYKNTYSPTIHTILYVNEGNGNFTNVLDNELTSKEAHTAKIVDQDNDGDLDIITYGNSYDNSGHNYLFVNEGNENSFIEILCSAKNSCATPYGTRIYAKTMINNQYVSQIRELSPIDGNVSFKYTSAHFGLGDAEMVDSLIIRWPSGHIDTHLNVWANQFYHAIEDSTMLINFKAINHIQLGKSFSSINFSEKNETLNIDLNDYYKFIIGDTVPIIKGDTLEFVLHTIENNNVVDASIKDNVLSLVSGTINGSSKIQLIARNEIAKRMDELLVNCDYGVSISSEIKQQSLKIYPNPAINAVTIDVTGNYLGTLKVSNIVGEEIISKKLSKNKNLKLKVDLSLYPSGLYIVSFISKESIISQKIILVSDRN